MKVAHLSRRQTMLTGRRTGPNLYDVTLDGAPTNQVWVRAFDASREETPVWGVCNAPNIEVEVDFNKAGERFIASPEYSLATQTAGDGLFPALQPLIPPGLFTGIIEGEQFGDGLVTPPDGDGLAVRIRSFAHKGGFWQAQDVPIDDPATANTQAWVLCGVLQDTNAATYYVGDAYPLTFPMTKSQLADISVADGFIPCGAVLIRNGQTEVTARDRFVRWSYFLEAAGDGGSIAVSDGTTTVDPATLVDYDPDFFEVTDGGGGTALVTFIGDTGGVDVTDGVITVSPATTLRIGANLTLTDNGGGEAELEATGGSGGDVVVTKDYADDYVLIVDQKTQNTQGGTFTNGAWRTRDLNTEVSDVAGIASISSNQFTLAAGTYRIRASAPAYAVDVHRTRLYNVTDAAVVQNGTSEYTAPSTVNSDQTRSQIDFEFTIATSKTFEIQHRCITTRATVGLGVASNLAEEIYTVVELWRRHKVARNVTGGVLGGSVDFAALSSTTPLLTDELLKDNGANEKATVEDTLHLYDALTATFTNKSAPASMLTSGVLAAGRAVAEVTTTSTGNIDDFAIGTAPVTLLRMSNASDATLRGMSAGVGGQIVIIESVGAGNVFLAHQNAGSSAANRLINTVTAASTPLAAGKGKATYVYDGTSNRWRLAGHEQGGYIPYTTSWTGTGSNPTVGTGGTLSASYQISGVYVEVSIALTIGTGFSPGSGFWYFTLPFTLPAFTPVAFFTMDARDMAPSFALYPGQGILVNGTQIGGYNVSSAGAIGRLSPTVPHTWASTDTLALAARILAV